MCDKTIMLLAIGGAGGNILTTIRRETKHPALKNARYVFADSDENGLNERDTEAGKILVVDSEDDVFPANIFNDVQKLTIVAGFGGKTGTKFTELAARAAIEAGVADITVVATPPFAVEGAKRTAHAATAVQSLARTKGIRTYIFDNETFLTRYPQLNLFTAFDTVDKEIMQTIENLE